jgi:hypothetical protein
MRNKLFKPMLTDVNSNWEVLTPDHRPTKRGTEKSPSDGHCQCEKEMDDHLLSCRQILEREPHSNTLC